MFLRTPTDLDIDQWLDACVAADIKCAILTTKHHDGFALWPTSYHAPAHDPYSIAETTWYAMNGSPDIVELFVDGCRSRGIEPGLYFSINDTTYETRTATNETTEAASYIAMIETQLSELLSNYGSITTLWLDGWGWHMGYNEIPYITIRNFIGNISPNCVVVENSQTGHPNYTSDIDVYESGAIPAGTIK